MITRRQFNRTAAQGLAVLATPTLFSSKLVEAGSLGLKALVPSNVQIGAVVDLPQLQNPNWLPFLLDNFNLFTLARLKWGFTRPSATSFDFSASDPVVTFCLANKITMHGHNLCWNTLNPAWLTQTITSANAESILTKHISTVVGRYAGKMNSWDVVNEPVATWMGRSDGLYAGPWLNTLGPEYMDIAFHAAAAADPHALRILNTAHNEQGGPGCDAARVATLNLIEALLKRNVPIQAVGLESHLAGNISSGTTLSRSAFMAELRQFGLQILVTEIDVDDTLLPANFAARDALVSQCYNDYLTSIWLEAQPNRIIFFTPSDLNNWYDSVNSAPYIRSDGLNHRPGLLDASLAKKSAYQAVAMALTQFRN